MSRQINSKLPLLAGACALAMMVSGNAMAAGSGGSLSSAPKVMSAPPVGMNAGMGDISRPSAPGVHSAPPAGMNADSKSPGFTAPVTGTRIPQLARHEPPAIARRPHPEPSPAPAVQVDPPGGN